jgi:hypothetical protein
VAQSAALSHVERQLVAPSHLYLPQGVVVTLHAPPEHVPAFDWVVEPPGHVCVAHVVPSAIALHVPPPRLQALQAPHGPLSQQTPSVQWPVPHSWSLPQATPCAIFGWHVVPVQ